MKKIFIIALLSFSSPLWAAITFECAVKNLIDKTKTDVMKLTFLVDEENGKAYMIGNIGSPEVAMHTGNTIHSSYRAITFMEFVKTGIVQTTSIYIPKNNDGNIEAVHSRHTVVGDEIIPSQFRGFCIVKA